MSQSTLGGGRRHDRLLSEACNEDVEDELIQAADVTLLSRLVEREGDAQPPDTLGSWSRRLIPKICTNLCACCSIT